MQDQVTAVALAASLRKPYRVKQVAELLDVHVSTVYRAIESGALGALRIGRGRGGLRVPAVALEDFVRRAAVLPPALTASVAGEVA